MTECGCGHLPSEHQDATGRCMGESYDPVYDTTYKCLCPYLTEEKL
jgi:hypothetical protein